jgi:hypothetical protein
MEYNSFKSTDALFARVREDFHAYDNSGLLDEGRFYDYVVYIINILGIHWFRDAEEIIDVVGYKADLPQDFKLLEGAFKCTKSCDGIAQPDGIILKKRVFDFYPETQIPDTHVNGCTDCPDFWKLDPRCIFNRQEEILIQRDTGLTRYNNPVLLKIGNVNTKRCCTGNCVNVFSTSPDQITISNNKIYTNFEEGSIYLMYHGFPLDSETGLPLIPDNKIIEKCIEDYIKYNIVKNLVTNADADLSRLLEVYRADYKESMAQAQYETKLPTFSSMVNMIRTNRKSLDIYQLY